MTKEEMTNQEAIEILKSKMDGSVDTSYEWAEAIRMAIKALEQEPSEDCVSREWVLNKIHAYAEADTTSTGCSIGADCCAEFVEEAPSVIPKAKEGEWIVKDEIFYCSCCDNDSGLNEEDVYLYELPLPNYCQYCGARMKSIKLDCELLAEALKQEPSRATGKWIPVSERLPEEDEDVLVTVYFKGIKTIGSTGVEDTPPCYYVDIAKHIGGEWRSMSDEYKVAINRHVVIAWMPLPEPNKERKESDEE